MRVALVGAGRFAGEAHVPVWTRRPDAELTWLVDARPDVASEQAMAWGIPRWSSDYRDVVGHPEIDAVHICAPSEVHAEMTLAFLAAGQHVLLEKPLAADLEEGVAVLAADRAHDPILMVGENWLYSTAVTTARRILAEGAPWQPIMLQASHESPLRLEYPGRGRLGGDSGTVVPPGYLFSAGTHTFSVAQYLLGDIASVAGFSTPVKEGGTDTDLAIAARFENGVVGSFNFTGRARHLDGRKLSFRLIADRGILEFDVFSGRVVVTSEGRRTTHEVAVPSSVGFSNPALGYAEEIDHFMRCVRTGETPRTDAAGQLQTLAAVVAAYEAMDTGAVVPVSDLRASVEDPR